MAVHPRPADAAARPHPRERYAGDAGGVPSRDAVPVPHVRPSIAHAQAPRIHSTTKAPGSVW